MPLQLRKIENNIAYGDNSIYENSTVQDILKDVVFAGKVGSVAQITMLASIAHEIFSDILEETNQLTTRIQKLAKRTDAIASFIDGKAVVDTIELPKEFILSRTDSLLCKETIPLKTVKARYDRIQSVPPLHEIDPFIGAKQFKVVGETVKSYSDPSVFFVKWVADQEKKIGKSKDERDNKKAKRAMRKKLERDFSTVSTNDDQTHTRQKKKSANWRERITSTDQTTSNRRRRGSYIIRSSSAANSEKMEEQDHAQNEAQSGSVGTDARRALESQQEVSMPPKSRVASVRFAPDIIQSSSCSSALLQAPRSNIRPVSRAIDRSVLAAALELDDSRDEEDGNYPKLTAESLSKVSRLSIKSTASMYRGSIISWGNVSRRISKCYAQSVDSFTSRRTMPFAVRRYVVDSDDDEDEDDDSVGDVSEDESSTKELSSSTSPSVTDAPAEKDASNLPSPVSKSTPEAPANEEVVHVAPKPPPPPQPRPPPPTQPPHPPVTSPSLSSTLASSAPQPLPPATRPAPPPPPPPPPRRPQGPGDPMRANFLNSITTGKRLRPTATSEEESSPTKDPVPSNAEVAKHPAPSGSAGTPKPKGMSFLQELQLGGSKLKSPPAPTRKQAETAAVMGSSAINRILERRKHIQDDDSSSDDSDQSDSDWA